MNTDLGHLLMLIEAAKRSPTSMLDPRNRNALFDGIARALNNQEKRLAKLETLLTESNPHGHAGERAALDHSR